VTLVIIDSSILLASVLLDEPLTDLAQALMIHWTRAGVQLSAPRLFRSELVAVMRKAVFQKRITYSQGEMLLDKVLTHPVVFHDDDALMKSAYEIATRFNLPRTYDAQYLALAERLACDFWTADEKLLNSTGSQFSAVRWLGNFTP
jgi:predicted nucleic acid-binding protein